jgi:hypothetical protein
MGAIDLPPGIGLAGTPLGTFHAPRRARRLATVSLVLIVAMAVLTVYFVAQPPYRWRHASTQIVLSFAFVAIALLGFAVRRARVVVTRDGVRWGWDLVSFAQDAARIVCAHVYTDGVAFEARRGSWWFIAARDWDRFETFVRFLRRAQLPVQDHAGTAPLRARLQSYGRFLDVLLVLSVLSAFAVLLWAA